MEFFKMHAVVHKRVIPLPRAFALERYIDKRQKVAVMNFFLFRKEVVEENGADICFYEYGRGVERESADGAGGIRSNARKRLEHFGIVG